MVRTSQTAKQVEPIWDQQYFLDHNGKQSTRLKFSYPSPDASSNEGGGQEPTLAFQIYSTLPLEHDLHQLVDYLGSEVIFDGIYPFWEVYDVQSDVFSCIDHQRREIAHRKQRSQSSRLGEPLIPKIVRGAYDHRLYGFLIVITSDSYRFGKSNSQSDPLGPLWAHFDRRFPWKSTVNKISRLEDDPSMAKRIGLDFDEIEVLPEKLEIVGRRIQKPSSMSHDLKGMYRSSRRNDGNFDCGLDEDEGQPSDEVESGDTLPQQVQELSSQDFKVTNGPGDAITVANTQDATEPGLRYLIYVPFLHHSTGSTLENTARVFTSTLLRHLLPNTTINFEFHKPQHPSLSSIASLHRAQLNARPDLTTGALHTINGQSERFIPRTRNESTPLYPPIEPYKTFAVVLDKPTFVEGQGVLFLMCDGGKLKPLVDGEGTELEGTGGDGVDYDEVVVVRSAGMEEVARRLGMVVLRDM